MGAGKHALRFCLPALLQALCTRFRAVERIVCKIGPVRMSSVRIEGYLRVKPGGVFIARSCDSSSAEC